MNGSIERRRAQGKLMQRKTMERSQYRHDRHRSYAVGNARWPRSPQRHPGRAGAQRHYRELQELREEPGAGHTFETDTDTEVIVHLVDGYLADGGSPGEAVARALPRLEGAFAGHYICRRGRPDDWRAAWRSFGHRLCDGEMYFGSDAWR